MRCESSTVLCEVDELSSGTFPELNRAIEPEGVITFLGRRYSCH